MNRRDLWAGTAAVMGSLLPSRAKAQTISSTYVPPSNAFKFRVTDPAFGAIGDGASHPLSGVTSFNGRNSTGWTLAQWQAVLPAATATTNELNWAAIQSAVNAAITAGGGTVYIPAAASTYRMSNANSAGDASGVVQLPNAGEFASGAPAGPQVNILGDGQEASVLYWPSFLGTGKGAITCTTNRLTNLSKGFINDVGLIGPGSGNNMHGILWAGRRRMNRVSVQGFNHGFDILGDQTMHTDLIAQSCVDGLYFADRSSAAYYNNNAFHRFIAANCSRSGITTASATEIGETAFYDGGIALCPYGIFKESTGFVMLDGVIFQNTQFEALTTALAGDAQGGAAATSAIYNSLFIGTSFAWGGSKGTAILQIQVLHQTQFLGLRGINGGQWSAGTVATFSIGANQGSCFVCDAAQLTTNAGGLPVFNRDTVPVKNFDGT